MAALPRDGRSADIGATTRLRLTAWQVFGGVPPAVQQFTAPRPNPKLCTARVVVTCQFRSVMTRRYSVSYTLGTRSDRMPWEIFLTDEVNGWLDDLATVDDGSYRQVVYAIEALAEVGTNLGRPLVDRMKGSAIHNLKELRPGSAGSTEVRVCLSSTHGAARSCRSPETRRATGQAGTATPSPTRNSSMRPT